MAVMAVGPLRGEEDVNSEPDLMVAASYKWMAFREALPKERGGAGVRRRAVKSTARDKPVKVWEPGGAQKVLRRAPSNGSPHGRRAHACRAQKKRKKKKPQSLLSDLGDLSVFIDATYWYFLKARANGVLLR